MNRLSWDTTAPRRLNRKRAAGSSRPELGLVEAEAELIRVAWQKPQPRQRLLALSCRRGTAPVKPARRTPRSDGGVITVASPLRGRARRSV